MKIKWLSDTKSNIVQTKELINLEFALKKDLLQLLLKYPSLDCCDDFRCYVFYYNLDSKKLSISKATPEPFYSKFKKVLKLNPNFSELFG